MLMSFRGRNSCLIKTSPSIPSGTNEAEHIKLKAAPCLWLVNHVASELREQTLGLWCATTSPRCTCATLRVKRWEPLFFGTCFCGSGKCQRFSARIISMKKRHFFLLLLTWRRMRPIKGSVFWWLMTRGPRRSCERPF